MHIWAVVLVSLLAIGCSRKKSNFDADRERLKEYIVTEVPKGIQPLDVNFAGKLRLVGYDLHPPKAVRAGRRVYLTLYWRVDQPLEPGYRLFTHLLDGSGDRIESLDDTGALREPVGDRPALPPEAWEPGKIYVDQLNFKVPSSVTTSNLQLVAGLHRGDERLPILSGARDSANRAIIAKIPVDARRARRAPRIPQARPRKLEPATTIRLDGKLDEPAWKSAQLLELVDVATGAKKSRAPVRGSVRLLWNDQGFYVGFEVRDRDVVGTFRAGVRDQHLWTSDTVEIMVDPDGDGDNRDYYEIQINPQNLVFDSRFDDYNAPRTEPNGPFGHQDWSSNVMSTVRVLGTINASSDRDDGYTVEALLPWKAFEKAQRSPPSPGDTWRMNFYAIQQNDGAAWSPILGQGNFHKASRFGRVTWTAAP